MSLNLVKQPEKFVLPAAFIMKVFQTIENSKKLIPRKYAAPLYSCFSDHIIGVYATVKAEERSKNTISIVFQCNDVICRKTFKITCLKSEIIENQDLLKPIAKFVIILVRLRDQETLVEPNVTNSKKV